MAAPFRKKSIAWYIVISICGIFLAFSLVSIVLKLTGKIGNTEEVRRYEDVRGFKAGTFEAKLDISKRDLTKKADIIPTLRFNTKTVWPPKEKMPKGVNPESMLKSAMNPGLGIRGLHEKGITGKGVNVAIIDQPMYQDHPEFAGKIAAYKDFGCDDESSMNGPAVASLLVGENTGTAPGARVYYAAVPVQRLDSQYYAKAVEWIMEENAKLPSGEKIRVVSVSAAPSGKESQFQRNADMWDEVCDKAEKAGILILDLTKHRGIVASCWSDGKEPDNMARYMIGFPGAATGGDYLNKVLVPTSPRTTAEEYQKGDFGYQYTGRGGLSWAVPYCAGVLALGWQERPDIDATQMVKLLLSSAYPKNETSKIIYPKEFIKAVKEYKSK